MAHLFSNSFKLHQRLNLLFKFLLHLPEHFVNYKVYNCNVAKVKVIRHGILLKTQQNWLYFFIPVKIHFFLLLLGITGHQVDVETKYTTENIFFVPKSIHLNLIFDSFSEHINSS